MKIRNWKQKLGLTGLYAGVLAIFRVFSWPCVFQAALSIPCPGCGMTRALTAALKPDLAGAFRQHFMFWSVPVLYLMFLLDGRLLPGKWSNRILGAAIAAGFLAQWALRLAGC